MPRYEAAYRCDEIPKVEMKRGFPKGAGRLARLGNHQATVPPKHARHLRQVELASRVLVCQVTESKSDPNCVELAVLKGQFPRVPESKLKEMMQAPRVCFSLGDFEHGLRKVNSDEIGVTTSLGGH
jgi:hypothetical protein